MLQITNEPFVILDCDPGVTNGLAVVRVTKSDLYVNILHLQQCSHTLLTKTTNDLIQRYQPNLILFEDFIHYTKTRDTNTTITIQGVGKIKAIAEMNGLPWESIMPGRYRFAEKRWPKELAPYGSHSGAALKQILTYLYHDHDLHKITIRDSRESNPHNRPDQVPTVS